MSQIRVACVQMRSGTDVAENIAAADALIREAARGGAELIATPERNWPAVVRPRAMSVRLAAST